MGLAAGLAALACLAPGDGGAAQEPAAAAARGDPARAWVGTRHDARRPPAGATFVAWSTVGEASDTTRQIVGEVVAGGRRMLWLSVRTSAAGGSAPAPWVVTDAVRLPARMTGRAVGWPGLCGRRRRAARPAAGPPQPEDVALEPALVAVVRVESGVAVLTRVERAWRADPARDRLVPLPARDLGALACLNDEGED
jgi:hypothetical protein